MSPLDYARVASAAEHMGKAMDSRRPLACMQMLTSVTSSVHMYTHKRADYTKGTGYTYSPPVAVQTNTFRYAYLKQDRVLGSQER